MLSEVLQFGCSVKLSEVVVEVLQFGCSVKLGEVVVEVLQFGCSVKLSEVRVEIYSSVKLKVDRLLLRLTEVDLAESTDEDGVAE